MWPGHDANLAGIYNFCYKEEQTKKNTKEWKGVKEKKSEWKERKNGRDQRLLEDQKKHRMKAEEVGSSLGSLLWWPSPD